MATLYTEQSKNVGRTWLLMVMFVAIVVVIGWFISYYYNNEGILVAAVLFSLVMNGVSYWFSDKIALASAHARAASASEYPELYKVIDNLSIASGLPTPKIYIIDDVAPNAFATGRDKKHASIAVTTGLLNRMNKNELTGVLAHEFSHIGNRDILLQSVVVVLVGFVAILADMFTRSVWLGGGRRRDDERGGAGILMIVGIIFVVLSPIIAQLIQLAISRKREFLADADGALLTRYPEGLASALEKIQAYSEPMEHASNATAHLYISNPFGARAFRGISRLFMTHPPIEERIRILRGMDV